MALFGVKWSLFVDASRLLSISVFLICSLTFTWYSFAAVIGVLVSLYLLDRERYTPKPAASEFPSKNPYKRKKKLKDEHLVPLDVRQKYAEDIADFAVHDAENSSILSEFELVQMNTECIFSKKAVLWGATEYEPSLTLEQNVHRSIPALIKFIAVGKFLHLDGFVFKLPGEEFGQDVHSFGEGVRRVLKCISDCDPIGFHCMNKSYVGQVGWSFELNGEPIFVTTFAPCYPENHSRFSFGSRNAFVLLQPMYSFAIHDIGDDTPHTNWEKPKTVRDKIRCAYRENNRGYHIRKTIMYPTAHDIVKPLDDSGFGEIVEWWKAGGEEREEKREDQEDDLMEELNLEEDEESSEEEESLRDRTKSQQN